MESFIFDISSLKSVPGCLCETHQTPETERKVIRLLRTNISLPLKSPRVSELYHADPAVWIELLRLKETPLNTTVNIQSNGSIKEAYIVTSCLTESAAGAHSPLLTEAGL